MLSVGGHSIHYVGLDAMAYGMRGTLYFVKLDFANIRFEWFLF